MWGGGVRLGDQGRNPSLASWAGPTAAGESCARKQAALCTGSGERGEPLPAERAALGLMETGAAEPGMPSPGRTGAAAEEARRAGGGGSAGRHEEEEPPMAGEAAAAEERLALAFQRGFLAGRRLPDLPWEVSAAGLRGALCALAQHGGRRGSAAKGEALCGGRRGPELRREGEGASFRRKLQGGDQPFSRCLSVSAITCSPFSRAPEFSPPRCVPHQVTRSGGGGV